MPLNNLHDLFEHELKDVYAAEQQNLRALEMMQNQARDKDVRTAIEQHIGETRTQIERLDTVVSSLNMRVDGASCPTMEGMMKEKHHFEQMNPIAELMDVYNVGASVKAERYEISSYEMLIELAAKLGMEDVAAPLQENLREEQAMLKRLTTISKNMSVANAKPQNARSTQTQGARKSG